MAHGKSVPLELNFEFWYVPEIELTLMGVALHFYP